MTRTRTIAACHTAAVNDLAAWPAELPDEHGNQLWNEAELAARHLASLTPERRAELNAGWSD